MIDITIPQGVPPELEARLAQLSAAEQAHIRANAANLEAVLKYAASLTAVNTQGQALDALLGAYMTLATSVNAPSHAMQRASEILFHASMDLAQRAAARRSSEVKALAANPLHMPTSGQTH